MRRLSVVYKHITDATSTSTMGSMAMSAFFKHQPTPAYKVSKAALNMLTVQYSEALEVEGFTVVALCPGVSLFPQVHYAGDKMLI